MPWRSQTSQSAPSALKRRVLSEATRPYVSIQVSIIAACYTVRVTAAIQLESVSKTFFPRSSWGFLHRADPVIALRDISFSIRPGSLFVLLGANGSGKTTLLRLVTTLLLPERGRIHVQGFDTVRQGDRAREVLNAIFPGERGFYWRLTARQNLLFFAALYNCTSSDAKRKIQALAEELGFSAQVDKPFETLSTGLQQRVVLARARLREAPILIADELTRSLDLAHKTALHQHLKTLVRRGGTVLLTTHDPAEAIELADDVGLLRHGSLAGLWSAEALRSGRVSLAKELLTDGG
jgi:ABC-2 type transport system ATP-binding protein